MHWMLWDWMSYCACWDVLGKLANSPGFPFCRCRLRPCRILSSLCWRLRAHTLLDLGREQYHLLLQGEAWVTKMLSSLSSCATGCPPESLVFYLEYGTKLITSTRVLHAQHLPVCPCVRASPLSASSGGYLAGLSLSSLPLGSCRSRSSILV